MAFNKPNMLESEEPNFDILDTAKHGDSRAGLLQTTYSLKFKCKAQLTQEQENASYACLNMLAEDTGVSKEIRAWCLNEILTVWTLSPKTLK